MEGYPFPMNRAITLILAAIIVFGGWTLLKDKVFTPQGKREMSAPAPAAPAEKILWTADGSEVHGGDDPRAVFAAGLNRYLGRQVSGASVLPLDRIDAAVVSQTDDTAYLITTLQGIRYHGRLKWADNGWTLVELSREP